MELILNLAWASCSLTLILLWLRFGNSDPAVRRVQVLALAMVVLLLLPVISLSDDLIAMQTPAETSSSARRAMNADDNHPLAAQPMISPLEQSMAILSVSGYAPASVQPQRLAPPPPVLVRSLDRRPPPQA
jgi:hypothetical protein